MRRWDGREIAFLREATAMRFEAREIARLLDRTADGVQAKRQALGIRVPPAPPAPSPPRYMVCEIKAIVARHFRVSSEDLSSRLRTREVVRPRHVAMMFARDVANKSLPDIGRMFKRDHSSVLAGIRGIRKQVAEDADLAGMLIRIRREIKPVDNGDKSLVPYPLVRA